LDEVLEESKICMNSWMSALVTPLGRTMDLFKAWSLRILVKGAKYSEKRASSDIYS